MSPSNSTRWSPTPEQLMILEEMYRGGVRTPNASQIQKITAHLSFYGRIEGKNVFYWFQNHKARERQKLKRKLSKQLYQQQLLQEQLHLHQYHDHQNNFLSFSGASPSPALHHQSLHKSADCLPQAGTEAASTQMIKNYYTWRADSPKVFEIPNCPMKTCCDECMVLMMRDGSQNLPYCSNLKPLKTLELFPITTPSVKDQSTSLEPTTIFNSASP